MFLPLDLIMMMLSVNLPPSAPVEAEKIFGIRDS
jgi:hypothetical protein